MQKINGSGVSFEIYKEFVVLRFTCIMTITSSMVRARRTGSNISTVSWSLVDQYPRSPKASKPTPPARTNRSIFSRE